MSDAGGAVSDGVRFELPAGGQAIFTARNAGNLSEVRGIDREHAARARERLREDLGLRRLCAGRQVHGAVVSRLRDGDPDEGPGALVEADGAATSVAGVGAMVLNADCLPVALGCDGAVAMLHAGWRGLAAGVLEEGVRALKELAAGDRIDAVIGPGAGVCCYEVGPEVHAALGEPGRERGPIDLRAIARARLLAAGVSEVLDLPACTICDERYFSHRREGERAGRQAGVAWLS
jgi:YfiH family protein